MTNISFKWQIHLDVCAIKCYLQCYFYKRYHFLALTQSFVFCFLNLNFMQMIESFEMIEWISNELILNINIKSYCLKRRKYTCFHFYDNTRIDLHFLIFHSQSSTKSFAQIQIFVSQIKTNLFFIKNNIKSNPFWAMY